MPRSLFPMVILNLIKTGHHMGPNPKPAYPDSLKGPISPCSCLQTLIANSKTQCPLLSISLLLTRAGIHSLPALLFSFQILMVLQSPFDSVLKVFDLED